MSCVALYFQYTGYTIRYVILPPGSFLKYPVSSPTQYHCRNTPTQHYITPRDRGRITISWLVLGLCITMCNIYFKILSFEIFRSFLSSQAGRITQYLKCFFFSSCIGWETQSEMLKWMMSDDTDSRRWQNTAVRECICWASDGGGEAKTGKGTQHSGHNKQVGLGTRCRLPAN